MAAESRVAANKTSGTGFNSGLLLGSVAAAFLAWMVAQYLVLPNRDEAIEAVKNENEELKRQIELQRSELREFELLEPLRAEAELQTSEETQELKAENELLSAKISALEAELSKQREIREFLEAELESAQGERLQTQLASVESGLRPVISASRAFAGPGQHPPEDYKAYGILAFPALASSESRKRHLMICEAYVGALSHEIILGRRGIARADQMVTVWPIDSDNNADRLNRMPRDVAKLCEAGVDNYGLAIAQQALAEANLAGVDVSGQGPYLLAWAPSTNKGASDALVLVSDLSNVTAAAHAEVNLRQWRNKIEADPELWEDDGTWNLAKLERTIEQIRVYLSHLVDREGQKIFSFEIANK